MTTLLILALAFTLLALLAAYLTTRTTSKLSPTLAIPAKVHTHARQTTRILSQVDRRMLRYHHTDIASIRHGGINA